MFVPGSQFFPEPVSDPNGVLWHGEVIIHCALRNLMFSAFSTTEGFTFRSWFLRLRCYARFELLVVDSSLYIAQWVTHFSAIKVQEIYSAISTTGPQLTHSTTALKILFQAGLDQVFGGLPKIKPIDLSDTLHLHGYTQPLFLPH